MDINEHIEYWIKSAEHDLDTAEALFSVGKYDWCLFLGHLVLEKALKAFYVRDNDNRIPPKTHNLVKLAEKTTLPMNLKKRIFFDEVNDFHIETRYPEYKQEFYKTCTREYAEEYFKKIKEQFTWIKSLLESKEL
ncbi:MAG: HEPN domain-containing protein [Thermodesulfobacteriota bacterium]|nr:HEPN domain-containing protein [Thermodesulfobacteriota bacterium]